jgi:hypothetical protein
MKLKGGWEIKQDGEFFVLISPTGAVKGKFASLKEAKERMESISALKRLSKELPETIGKSKPFIPKEKK